MSRTDNEYKVAYATSATIIYFIIALFAGRVTSNFQVAFGIVANYYLWCFLWIKILVQSEHIYSVKVLTEVLPDWVPFSLPAEKETLKIRKDRVVTSISELSGIRGGYMLVALRVMSAVNCALTFIAIQNDLHYRKANFLVIKSSEDMVPIFLFIAGVGKFYTGYFELNLMDKTHSKGHYLGVMGISLGSFAIGFCLKWSWLSIILLMCYYGIATIWTIYLAKCPKRSNDIRVVTRTSKMCIGIELAMFNTYNAILFLTCYASGENEGSLYVSPFL